jgi:hypothetical protein
VHHITYLSLGENLEAAQGGGDLGSSATRDADYLQNISLKMQPDRVLQCVSLAFSVVGTRFKMHSLSSRTHSNRGKSSLICKEGCRFSTGWCTRGPYCPLSSAVCNATIPTLPLFAIAESACLPFCDVLRYLLFIKFISAFYHVCVTGQLL